MRLGVKRLNLHIVFIGYRDLAHPAAVGGDIYLWELAKGLSKLGHQVTFMCSRFDGSKSRETKDGIDVVRIKGSMWSLPFRIFKEYFRRPRDSFDIVVEEAIGGQRLPFFSTLYVRKPLVAVWHQRHQKIFREQYPLLMAIFLSLVELFLATLYRNRTIISPSEDAKKNIVPLGFYAENIKVVNDGVGEIFRNVKKNPNRENLVVCLGKMRRYKRFDHAILGFQRAINRLGIPWRLVLAGKISEIDGGYIERLRKLAKTLSISENVIFKINISEIEKLELLKKAKLLVQPSPVEGFSIVVVEANSCGTPVIASDGVPKDVVRDGYNGFIYPFGDLEALANGIVKLISNEVVWRSLSTNAYEWAQKFTWERSSLKFEKVLADMLSKNNRSNLNCKKLRVSGGMRKQV